MESFHRADWIGIAQAAGGMLAVIAAFIVSSLQSRHAAKLRRQDGLERLEGLAKLIELARVRVDAMLEEVPQGGSNLMGGPMSPIKGETIRAAAIVYDAVIQASIADAPSAKCVEALLDAKTAYREVDAMIGLTAFRSASRMVVQPVTMKPLKGMADRLKFAEEVLRAEHARLSR